MRECRASLRRRDHYCTSTEYEEALLVLGPQEHLEPELLRALLDFRAAESNRLHRWSLVEDARLLRRYKDGVPLEVAGRSVRSVRKRILRLRQRLHDYAELLHRRRPPPTAPFSKAATHPEAPLQLLAWSKIRADCALPTDAHVDWIKVGR